LVDRCQLRGLHAGGRNIRILGLSDGCPDYVSDSELGLNGKPVRRVDAAHMF
jgi:hypothetical protein